MVKRISIEAEKIIDEFLRLHVKHCSDAASIGWRDKIAERRSHLRRDTELLLRTAGTMVSPAELVDMMEQEMAKGREPPASPLFIAQAVRAVAARRAMGRPKRRGRPAPEPVEDSSPRSDYELAPMMSAKDYRQLSAKARQGDAFNAGERLRYAAYVLVWRALHRMRGTNPADPRGLLYRPRLVAAAEEVLCAMYPREAEGYRRIGQPVLIAIETPI